jgi:hypothetical protein
MVESRMKQPDATGCDVVLDIDNHLCLVDCHWDKD